MKNYFGTSRFLSLVANLAAFHAKQVNATTLEPVTQEKAVALALEQAVIIKRVAVRIASGKLSAEQVVRTLTRLERKTGLPNLDCTDEGIIVCSGFMV